MRRDLPASIMTSMDIQHSFALPAPSFGVLETVLADIQEAVVKFDTNWVATFANEVYLKNVGLSHSEVVGRTPFEYQPSFSRSIFYSLIEDCRKTGHSLTRVGFSSATNRWVLVRVLPVSDGMVVLANDATEHDVRQVHLAEQALRDPLTSLGNKHALEQDLREMIGNGETFSLAVIGLNRFTALNHAQGYSRGDMALMEMASRLLSATSTEEQLYRLNGDEFAFITVDDRRTAKRRIRMLLELTRESVSMNGQMFVLGAAAGSVCAPLYGSDPESLLQRALHALRHAKRVDREGLIEFHPNLEAESRNRATLESDLRAAVNAGQFSLMLQPKGCLRGRHVMGAEALIRWTHPTRGVLAPDVFLPLAQECGLMPEIDRWVIRTALAHVRTLKNMGIALPVAVNLSVDSLSDANMVQNVVQALKDADVEPHLLEIEIPEGALMRDVATSAAVLESLHALGIGISVDDFGTGYSSLAYLARFPVQTLKVDRSFVIDMTTNKANHNIVKGLVQLAHSLSMRVVAEGAETDEQMTMLESMRCDEVQGFGYSRPVSFDSFCEFARDNVATPLETEAS